MFCNQCEQTAKGIGCTKIGVCGKSDETAALQDLLTYAVQGLSLVAVDARNNGIVDNAINRFTAEAVFACLTNVDFDPLRFQVWINKAVELREQLKARVKTAGSTTAFTAPAAVFAPAATLEGLIAQGQALDFINSLDANEDLRSLKQIAVYGIRGLAAYADHAAILGQEDDSVYAYIHTTLAELTKGGQDLGQLVGMVLKCGEVNLKAMELLDAGNTGTYGHPTPTPVPLGHKAGKAILVSGHDLRDLDLLLQADRGQGHQHLHPRGDAAHPRLSRPEKTSPLLWPLRHRLAEPGQGIPHLPRGHPLYHQLHPEAPPTPTRPTSSPPAWWAGRIWCTSARTRTSPR
jgi:hydroxylamine reductase